GPMFQTGSKRNPDPVVGTAELARLRALTDRPVVAIGGIDRENCGAVFQAGVNSVAVIGDLFPAGGSLADLRRRAEEGGRVGEGGAVCQGGGRWLGVLGVCFPAGGSLADLRRRAEEWVRGGYRDCGRFAERCRLVTFASRIWRDEIACDTAGR